MNESIIDIKFTPKILNNNSIIITKINEKQIIIAIGTRKIIDTLMISRKNLRYSLRLNFILIPLKFIENTQNY